LTCQSCLQPLSTKSRALAELYECERKAEGERGQQKRGNQQQQRFLIGSLWERLQTTTHKGKEDDDDNKKVVIDW
jgi:hypothetical protein